MSVITVCKYVVALLIASCMCQVYKYVVALLIASCMCQVYKYVVALLIASCMCQVCKYVVALLIASCMCQFISFMCRSQTKSNLADYWTHRDQLWSLALAYTLASATWPLSVCMYTQPKLSSWPLNLIHWAATPRFYCTSYCPFPSLVSISLSSWTPTTQ